VAGRLRGHHQVVLAGETHRLDHVLRGAGGKDGIGADLDRQVPCGDEGGVVGVAVDGDGSRGAVAQLVVGRDVDDRLDVGHWILLGWCTVDAQHRDPGHLRGSCR
jgi:hypothetical protein